MRRAVNTNSSPDQVPQVVCDQHFPGADSQQALDEREEQARQGSGSFLRLPAPLCTLKVLAASVAEQ